MLSIDELIPTSCKYALNPGNEELVANDPDTFNTKLPDGPCCNVVVWNTSFPDPSVDTGAVGCNTWVTTCTLADWANTAILPLSIWYPSSYNNRVIVITPAFFKYSCTVNGTYDSSVYPPNISWNSENEFTFVGICAGPFIVVPIIDAPISLTPLCKKDWSFSLVNTPGDTILSAIKILLLIVYYKYK